MKILRWVIALTISGAGLWFAVHGLDWAETGRAFQRLESPFWLFLTPFVLLTEFTLRSVRWKILLNPLKRVPFSRVFPITAGGFFLNMVLPFRAGELARVYWTTQVAEVPISSSMAILAADRLLDMISLISLVFLILTQKSSLIQSQALVWLFGGVSLGGMLSLILLARHPQKFRTLTKRWLPVRLAGWADQFLEGAVALGRGRSLLLLYLISMSFWIMDAMFYRQVAGSFGASLTFIDGIFVIIAFCFGAFLPSAPGFVGTLEAAGVAAFLLLGYGKEISLPLILAMHTLMILSNALWGIPSILVSGLRVGKPASNH